MIDIKKIMIKALTVLLSSVMLLTIFLSCITYGKYTKSFSASISATAADFEDIIEKFIVDKQENPEKMIIQKRQGLKTNPVLYFSVEGEAKKYILHINPVKIAGEGEYEVEIPIKVNTYDIIDLINKTEINGKIYVKYLNEYLNKPIEIKFTRDYLVSKYQNNVVSNLSLNLLNSTPEVEILAEDEIQELNLDTQEINFIYTFSPRILSYIDYLRNKINELIEENKKSQEKIKEMENEIQKLNEELQILKQSYEKYCNNESNTIIENVYNEVIQTESLNENIMDESNIFEEISSEDINIFNGEEVCNENEKNIEIDANTEKIDQINDEIIEYDDKNEKNIIKDSVDDLQHKQKINESIIIE